MDEQLVSRYRAVGSAAVFSALNRLGAPMRLLSLDIRPIDPGQVVVGPAFTLKAVRDPRTHHAPGTEVAKLDDYAMFRAMTPGCVIVADAGERERSGFWGDLMSAASRASGASGIVVDGLIRDTRQLLLMEDFAVFARGSTMTSTERRTLTVDFQVPIAVAGAYEHQVGIEPGDWIYGDVDGVVVFSAELVEEVLRSAEEAEARETLIRRDFEAGMPVWEVYPKHRRL